MSDIVNLDNLRALTDGDVDTELELFDLFYESSAECLAALKACLETGEGEIWRKQAHALKGIALGLGAQELGDLCKQAQDQWEASLDTKQKMLAEIRDCQENVETFLRNVHGV